MEGKLHMLSLPPSLPSLSSLISLKVHAGDQVQKGTVMATYGVVGEEKGEEESVAILFKSTMVGKVCAVLHEEGDMIQPNEPLFKVEDTCDHSIVVFDMCADCGLNLRRYSSTAENFLQPISASVSMIHGIPELRVSQKEAEQLGNKDSLRLLTSRKLALIVDLDQTLVHTSMDSNIEPGLPDVYGFHLPDHHLLYHCRLRPHTRHLLEKISKLYEMHVFTMGTKSYAASVTRILDPEGKFFCDRIISRDECFDPRSKALRLKSVFPCGDSMVAIIDDREDVWGRSPNLIHVKPYMFFAGTTDINAPPPHSLKRRPPHPRRMGKGFITPQVPPRVKAMRHKRTKIHRLQAITTSSGSASLKQNGSGTGHSGTEPEPESTLGLDSGIAVTMSSSEVTSEQIPSTGEQLSTDNQPEEPIVSSTLPGDAMETEVSLMDDSSSPDTVSSSTEVVGSEEIAGINNNNNNNKGDNNFEQDMGNTDQPGSSSSDGSNSDDDVAEQESGVGNVVEQVGDSVAEQEGGVTNVAEQEGGVANVAEQEGGVTNVAEQEGGVTNVAEQEGGATNVAEQTGGVTIIAEQVDGVQSDSSDSSSDSSDSSSSSGIDDSIFDQPLEGEPPDGVESLPLVGSGGGGVVCASTASTCPSDKPTGDGVPRTAAQVCTGREATPQFAPGVATPTASTDAVAERQGRRGLREIHDPDDFLLHLMDILERIHSVFYERYDAMTRDAAATATSDPIPDLKLIIPELRHSILSDCCILFTGVIPTNIPVRKNPEWNTARAFGATIHTQLVPGLNSSNQEDVKSATTHVIAAKPGTSKLLEARRMPGVKIVNPKWLWACAEQWKKADEDLYCMQAEKRKRSDRSEVTQSESEIQRKVTIFKKKGTEKENGEGSSNIPISNTPIAAKVKPRADMESSDSDDEKDDIFRNSSFAELAKMDTTELKRHLSIESRLSVSDEELGRMDAEVEAEISSSDGSERGKKEGLGSHMEMFVDNEDELSYEKFAGTHASQDIDVVERLNRKRRFAELDASGSLFVEHSNESPASDNDVYDDDSGDDGDDELGALLGFGGVTD